jgi:hypothetical protein
MVFFFFFFSRIKCVLLKKMTRDTSHLSFLSVTIRYELAENRSENGSYICTKKEPKQQVCGPRH